MAWQALNSGFGVGWVSRCSTQHRSSCWVSLQFFLQHFSLATTVEKAKQAKFAVTIQLICSIKQYTQFMITQMMVQPSFWVESGIKISKVRNLHLFKFTDELQSRLEELSLKRKAGFLTSEEEAELTGILELDRIFTLLNARIIAES